MAVVQVLFLAWDLCTPRMWPKKEKRKKKKEKKEKKRKQKKNMYTKETRNLSEEHATKNTKTVWYIMSRATALSSN